MLILIAAAALTILIVAFLEKDGSKDTVNDFFATEYKYDASRKHKFCC